VPEHGPLKGADPGEVAVHLLAAVRAGERFDAAALAAVNPADLDGDASRGAFWADVYNALVLDQVQRGLLAGDVRRSPGFFRRTTVDVGGRSVSVHVIEHGLLRANRPAPWSLLRPLGAGDARCAWALSALDARVHFALNCGARSCPPIAAYEASRWDAQLDLATRSYLSSECRVVGDVVLLPWLMKLYARDFPAPREFAARFAPAEVAERIFAGAKLGWAPYDWAVVG